MKSTTLVERRTFIRNASAALSATVAATAAVVSEPTSAHEAKPAEDEIRQLHNTFVERLNGRLYDEPRERPYVAHFVRPLPAGMLRPVHDYLLGHEQHLDTIEVAPDQCRATARFHCLTRMEAALSPTLPLIEMARQQGQGVIQWWESGVLESICVRSQSGWQISQWSFRSNGLWS